MNKNEEITALVNDSLPGFRAFLHCFSAQRLYYFSCDSFAPLKQRDENVPNVP